MKFTRPFAVFVAVLVGAVFLAGCSAFPFGQSKISVGDCVVTSASSIHGIGIKKTVCANDSTAIYRIASVQPDDGWCFSSFTTFKDEATNRTYCLSEMYQPPPVQPRFAVDECVVTWYSYDPVQRIKKVPCSNFDAKEDRRYNGYFGQYGYYRVESIHPGKFDCDALETFYENAEDLTYCLDPKAIG